MRKSVHKKLWITALLFSVAAFFRFRLLGASPFKADTMEFYKLALRHQSIIEFWENPPWMNQIPLNETLSLLLIKAGLPATPFVVRLPFALMGVLALFFVWRFTRRWFSTDAALLTLLLAVFNPYQIYFSRSAYHYSGAACWSAALFLAFWSIKETLLQNREPSARQTAGWVAAAVAACHMHMSVWPVVGLQAGLLVLFGWIRLKQDKPSRIRFLLQMSGGSLLLGLILSRWIFRAVKMIFGVSSGTEQYIGSSAASELLRLLPAYFAGENIFAVALLLIFILLAAFALFGSSAEIRRFRSLAWICVLHIAVLMLYVALVGGGVAKIAYFSAVWPHIILLTGIGAVLGVRKMASGFWCAGLYVFLAGGYIALTAWPNLAIVQLEGKPTPFYKINDWVQSHLAPGTPVLTDRWFEPWNELAVHNPGGLNYAFTVPDEPIENYKRFNWPETVRQFFEKYPESAFLELSRDRFAEELGPWTFPEEYFARTVSITNEPAMVLRQWKVFPEMDYAAANTNRVVVRIFYNTPEDLLAAARRDGKETLRLWSEGWGYAKPGWPQGDFRDFRILGRAALCDLYNLTGSALHGVLEISAAAAGTPKPVTVNGTTTVFSSPGLIRAWKVPLTLQPGENKISFTSPSEAPLFVLDLRWNPDPL